MIKKIFAGAFLGLLIFGYFYTIGPGSISPLPDTEENTFPSLVGIDLNGKEFTFPDSLPKPLNLIIVAFEREQQKDVNTWIAMAENLMAEHENLSFYEVPLIYEINAPFRFWINNGMRSGIPDDKTRKRTITVYTERGKFTSLMAMETTSIYALLLNQKGEILWRAKGLVTLDNIDSLKQAILKLNAS